MSDERMFPIQSQRGAKAHPLSIPWSVAELAYSVYAGLYGRSQSLERLAERGGFGPGEMDMFLPDWRERCDEIERLRAELTERTKERDEFLKAAREMYRDTVNYETIHNTPAWLVKWPWLGEEKA